MKAQRNLNAPLERKIKRKKKKKLRWGREHGRGKWNAYAKKLNSVSLLLKHSRSIFGQPHCYYRPFGGLMLCGATSYRLVSASVNQSRWLGGLSWIRRGSHRTILTGMNEVCSFFNPVYWYEIIFVKKEIINLLWIIIFVKIN